MKLPAPFIQLPISFDAAALAREISQIEDMHWRPHPDGMPGNSALTLVTTAGDPDSDGTSGSMRPTPWLLRLPYLMQALEALGATWGRSRLMRLSGQSEVSPHVDVNYYWRERMRVHVPIITTPSVRFHCGDSEINMAAGECWIFDTWRRHCVLNHGDDTRIHLVADTVGGERFWDLVAQGRTPEQREPGWQPKRLDLRADENVPVLDFESFNLPVVMSPWELREHIVFLLNDAEHIPQLAAIQITLQRFARCWHALWSCHGTDPGGFPRYRALLERTQQDLVGKGIAQIALRNGGRLMQALNAHVFTVALNEPVATPVSRLPNDEGFNEGAGEAIRTPARLMRDPSFDRPVFILSSPRSGSTLLFETLAQAPELFTIGGESHQLIEQVPGLAPKDRGFDSNVLTQADASPEIVQLLRSRFWAGLHDRAGRAPTMDRVRMLEKTPKNALRTRFLQSVFPEARFVFLYRDARETLGSMIDAWKSGRFWTYPGLPGWPSHQPWSLLLVPRWRELVTQPLHQVVRVQWERTLNEILDRLETLPRERWTALDYADFLKDPTAEIQRVCAALDLPWDRELGQALPLSRHTLTRPEPGKWRKHAELIEPLMPELAPTVTRAREAVEAGKAPR